jgi:hypothetical protein
VYQRHELLRAFAAHHGQWLNFSAVARTLATSRLDVGRHLRRLRSGGYLRLLPALPQPCAPDMIRRPRLYLRARAWRDAFASTPSAGCCMRVPVQGQLASRITDGVIERETTRRRCSGFYSMGRYRRRGVDLVVARPSGWRVGLCFEPRPSDKRADKAIAALREALASGWINAAILVSCEGYPGIGRGGVLQLPAPLFLAMYGQWTSESAGIEEVAALLHWLDEQTQVVLWGFSDPEEPLGLDGQYELLEEEEDPLEPFLLRPP